MDRVAESWLDTLLELQPEWHVELGRPGREGEYADHSPDGHAALASAAAAALRTVRETEPIDDVDRVTRLELERTLELAGEQHESGEWRRDLNVIASPAQSLREIFDLVPTDSDEDWHHVARRMRNVPAAVDGYVATLTDGILHDQTPAIRQVREVLKQTRDLASDGSFFVDLAGQGPDAQQQELHAAAADAVAAYARLSEFLAHTLAPAAREDDAVGREAYALASRAFVGLEVDLDETYAWGVDELQRMVAEQEEVAREIVPGGTVADAIAALDGGEGYFEVRHDPSKTFTVKLAFGPQLTVQGTSFNINAYPDEPFVRATLLDGKISVGQNGVVKVLAPGQQARWSDREGLKVADDADTDQAIAWKNGQFVFKSMDIRSIMRQISRWYDVEVAYSGAIGSDLFSGIVSRQSSLEQVLKILEEGGVRFRIEGRRITVFEK